MHADASSTGGVERRCTCPQQTAVLFYDFGLSEECRWNDNAERLGGLEVDDHLEGRWLLDRQIGGLGALEDLCRVMTDHAKGRSKACAIADQAANSGVYWLLQARRECLSQEIWPLGD